MAAGEIIFQNWVFQRFILPFLLVWTIIFAILQKTKLLGEGKKQIDSIVAFVIGIIVVTYSSGHSVDIISNLTLFLAIGIVIIFVGLLLWGFIAGEKGLKFDEAPRGLKWTAGIVILIAVIIAVLWAAGVDNSVFDFFFRNSWSGEFWTNFFFVAVVIGALILMLKSGASGKG